MFRVFFLPLLAMISSISFTMAAQPDKAPVPARPSWAEGIPLWGQQKIRGTAGGKDLAERPWEKGLVVAQDRKDTIYVLALEEGECEVYSPEGERIDTFQPAGWEPLVRSPVFTDFAVTASGDLFAALSGNTICLFTRKKVKMRSTLPTFATSLAFAGDDLAAGVLPVRLVAKGGQPSERPRNLIAWFDDGGEIRSEMLEADAARGPTPLAVAMTQGVQVVSEPGGPLWALDRCRLYRVRRLTPSGRAAATWISDRSHSPVSFSGEAPEGILELLQRPRDVEKAGDEDSDEDRERMKFQPMNARVLVPDAMYRDGFLWALAQVEDGSTQVIDVFDHDLDGPIARLGLQTEWHLAQFAVTDDAVWVFPFDQVGFPCRVERPQDWEIREKAYSGPQQGPSS